MAADRWNFSTWKFEWFTALATGTKGHEFRVAAVLLQHCNGDNGILNPSQARMAHLMDCSTSSVERAIKALIGAGIIERVRYRRQDSNHYRFVDAWKDRWLEEKARRDAEWHQMRKMDPAQMRDRDDIS